MATKDNALSLEQSFETLEKIVEKLETSNTLTLDESVALFEQGSQIVKQCQKMLTEAELKIQMLTKNGNQETLTAYQNKNNEE